MFEKIETLIENHLIEDDLTLYDVEFVKENESYFLKIYLDKKDGLVDLEQVIKSSKVISELLDEADFIDHEYFLEVSSSGAERKFKTREELENAIGQFIHVDFNNPISGLDEVEGDLVSFKDEMLLIEYKVKNIKKKVEFDYKNVKSARLAIKF